MRPFFFNSLFFLAAIQSLADAAEWDFRWEAQPDEKITAAFCPLKYDKKWAYAFEIDDGPKSAITVVQPLLASFHFTDAPPGVAGGNPLLFVGVAAVFPYVIDGDNPAQLTWDDLRTLRDRGWSIANHSYWHTGDPSDPAKMLSPDQFRRELFWSQSLLAMNLGDDSRAVSHFVYPTGDFNYEPYLREFGFRVATLVAGGSCNLVDPKVKPMLFPRGSMDEQAWVARGGAVMDSFPEAGPKPLDLFIDFTHDIAADPASANQKRWRQRLAQIAARYGQAGDDSVWCAPTGDVVDYRLALADARLGMKPGLLHVMLPADAPSTALTIRLDGFSPQTKLTAPDGATLYRDGSRAWITTPRLNTPGVPAPKPALKLVYDGPVTGRVDFDKSIAFAAVRLMQVGVLQPGFALRIRLQHGDEAPTLLDLDRVLKWVPLGPNWGRWLLFPSLPDQPASSTTAVELKTDPAFKRLQIYAVAE
jgi:peptidoglycan/xylan/chitin deacetylase (PgdA/CDA1 family)